MRTVTVSSKGQLAIPKELRDRMGVAAGARFAIESDGESVITLTRIDRERRRPSLEEIRRVAGILNYKGPARTDEEMDAAVSDMFRREADKWKKR